MVVIIKFLFIKGGKSVQVRNENIKWLIFQAFRACITYYAHAYNINH